MSIRPITSLVIAALLLTGTAVSVPGFAAFDAPAITQSNTAETTAPVATALTSEEAIAIALEHAGLTTDDVTGIRSEYDVDDWISEWEIDFRSGDYEYDYTIHAKTGSVLKWDKEYDPPKAARPAQTEPAATEAPVVETTPPVVETQPPVTEPETKELTKEEAIALALQHAGLTEGDVTQLRGEYEIDDRVPEWEIDFRSGDYEYDYTIHAETGKILKKDKEYDPEKKAGSTPTQPPATEPPATEAPAEKLTRDEAIAIALQHAGLAKDAVKGLRAEYDMDDRVPEWEIDFRSGNVEYEYTIHAESGKILEWDKDWDD